MKILILLAVSIALVSCAGSKNSEGLALNPTIYYKPTIHQKDSKCEVADMRELLSPKGEILTSLCKKDFDACLMQGSCFVDDGGKVTSYNYHSTKEDRARFITVDLQKCPYGYGVLSSCLDPYFSVAADLSIYKLGDVIFVPRLVGAVLPNGEVHDGYLVIRDSGGNIKGASRFDFFTGFLDHRNKINTLARLGFGDSKHKFEFRLASSDEKNSVQTRRNYPGLTETVLKEGLSQDSSSH